MGYAHRRARLLAAAAAVSLLAACSGGGEAPAAEPTEAKVSDTVPVAEPGTTPEVSYARHTVAPPGDLEGGLHGDDLLVVGEDTLPDDVVQKALAVRVDGKRAVPAAYQFSITQMPVENKLYNVAAVDPAEYRAFTAQQSAEHQEQWDRVAGGEIAVSLDLKKRLPLDEDGYLALATGDRVHKVHVGAYGPQVGSVDAVVNEEWGDALGMVDGNALVINTGSVSPQVVHEALDEILDAESMSVYELDAVAEFGLDPNAQQVASFVGSFADAVGTFRYSVIGGGRIAPEPAWVRSHIVTEQMPILGSMTCNKHMMPQLRAALLEIVKADLADEIHPEEYAGCYYPRFIAGSTKLSNHSFGLAFDINVPGNLRGTVGEIHRGVVAIFKKWGFAWGGDWNYTDPMHFELERIVHPS